MPKLNLITEKMSQYTDDELREMYDAFLIAEKSGIIHDGKLRDLYTWMEELFGLSMGLVTLQVVFTKECTQRYFED